MTPEQELEAMRAIYPYAAYEMHMLVEGEVRLRCSICKNKPVPKNYQRVIWCDDCLEEIIGTGETPKEFKKRKLAEAWRQHE